MQYIYCFSEMHNCLCYGWLPPSLKCEIRVSQMVIPYLNANSIFVTSKPTLKRKKKRKVRSFPFKFCIFPNRRKETSWDGTDVYLKICLLCQFVKIVFLDGIWCKISSFSQHLVKIRLGKTNYLVFFMGKRFTNWQILCVTDISKLFWLQITLMLYL